MRSLTSFVAVIVIVAILAAGAQQAMAGAQDTGEPASCEIAGAQGVPLLGNAGVSIDAFNLAVISYQTLAIRPSPGVIVIRALVGLDIGTSPMENVCQMLNGQTAEQLAQELAGGPVTAKTVAEQILAAAGLSNRVIKITKRGIFGCDVLPCANPALRPDFALVPGTAELGSQVTSALGTVTLYAVRP